MCLVIVNPSPTQAPLVDRILFVDTEDKVFYLCPDDDFTYVGAFSFIRIDVLASRYKNEKAHEDALGRGEGQRGEPGQQEVHA